MSQRHDSTTRRRVEQRTLQFPADHSIGRVQVRDEADAARTMKRWRRWAASERASLLRQLRRARLDPESRAVELEYLDEEHQETLAYIEDDTWEREYDARGVIQVATTDELWLRVDGDVGDLSPLHALAADAIHLLTLRCPVGDDDLAWVASLRSLRFLEIVDGSHLTGAGLDRLRSLTALTSLALYRSEVTDDDLAFLRALSNLRSLTLDCDGLGVGALTRLSAMHQLEALNLGMMRLTDDVIPYLCELVGLRELSASADGLSDAGWLHLSSALPDCRFWLWEEAVPPDIAAFEARMAAQTRKRQIAQQRRAQHP